MHVMNSDLLLVWVVVVSQYYNAFCNGLEVPRSSNERSESSINGQFEKDRSNVVRNSIRSNRHMLSFNFSEFFMENEEENKAKSIRKSTPKRLGDDNDRYPRGIIFTEGFCPIPVDETNTTKLQPECTLLNDVPGTWVCRTLYDMVTGEAKSFTACVNPNLSLTTDTCGCCDDICPDPCVCKCDLLVDNDQKGVLVSGTRYIDDDDDATDDDIRCIDPYRAYRLVTGPGFFRQPKCVTKCPSRKR